VTRDGVSTDEHDGGDDSVGHDDDRRGDGDGDDPRGDGDGDDRRGDGDGDGDRPGVRNGDRNANRTRSEARGRDPRLLLASLSGEADARWAHQASAYADLAVLGGIALDARSRDAARAMVRRDRAEFLPPDPLVFVDFQLATLASSPIRAGVNVRSATVDPVRRVARLCAAHDALVEVNAHCRQRELCRVGCGETLLRDTARLCDYVSAAAAEGATVGVKVRAAVDGVDLVETARRVADAGATLFHVDAMDSERVIADVAQTTPELFLVANNGVRDRATVAEYLDYGADAVSVGRPSTDHRVLGRVRRAVDEWFAAHADREADTGWPGDAVVPLGGEPADGP
jgi:TIM-barrel protein